MKRIGLVLEGGGMRGLYTAGVIDVMLEHEFQPNIITATSAGTTFGVNLLSKQKGRVLRYNKRFIGNKNYISFRSWLKTGNVVNTEFAYHLLPYKLDRFDNETFKLQDTRFYATITNMRTGKAEYVHIKDCDEQIDVIRASAALPILSKPVKWNGEEYLDGGLADNIPLDKCIELGCDKVIVVLTQPADYVKRDRLKTICSLWYPRRKKLLRTIAKRNDNYRKRQKQIRKLEIERKLFVIRPSKTIPIHRLEKDPKRLQEMYDLGYRDAQKCWDKLCKYLEK